MSTTLQPNQKELFGQPIGLTTSGACADELDMIDHEEASQPVRTLKSLNWS